MVVAPADTIAETSWADYEPVDDAKAVAAALGQPDNGVYRESAEIGLEVVSL